MRMERFMRRMCWRAIGVIGGCAVLATAGCSRSENQSLDALLKQTGKTRADVYPLAGKVTFDGQTPNVVWPDRLVVMLYDSSKPNLPPNKRPCRQCNDEGEFAFGTYTTGDGLRAGTFVVTFAVLKITMQGLKGPDQLKNLYNDPDRNAAVSDFNIVHQAPGKTDYAFDLKIAGQVPIATPGPKALTELRPGK